MEWSWHPVSLSFFVAAAATLVAFILAVPAAYLMANGRWRGRAVLETFFFLPLVLPPTVIGFLLILLFGNNSPVGRIWEWLTGNSMMFTVSAAILAAASVAFPLMYQSIKTGFQSVDPNILGAARVDGASNWKLLIFILIPLSMRALAAGAVLSYTRAFGEFGATLMFAGNIPGHTQTIPTAIYLAIETGQDKLAWYYVLISIFFSFILLYAISMAGRKS
ncbi:molybdate ABC transporter permease subunit [Virgibacillus xinjiangensis]|uniref:Molybdenum transport system permease n=1 Tax=Virgibacillus xinjiangensis TaxID=393090 RepID=A0ABV7CW67_9BACI